MDICDVYKGHRYADVTELMGHCGNVYEIINVKTWSRTPLTLTFSMYGNLLELFILDI